MSAQPALPLERRSPLRRFFFTSEILFIMNIGIVVMAFVAALQRPHPIGGAKLETLFESGIFTEGPAAAPDGTIYFSDITASATSREVGHIMRSIRAPGRPR